MIANGYDSKLETISINKKSEIKPNSNWYVFYTKPKAEKVVFKELNQRGYEVFLPITKTLRVWKNRQKKMVEQVLFPGYIFVYTKKCELFNINNLPKIVNIVHCAGIPSIIQQKDIEGIRKMLNLGYEISLENSLNGGDKVRVAYGPLAGYEGILIKQKGKARFGIQLKDINQNVVIDIDSKVLEKI